MSKFNCPICHKSFDVNDAVVEDIVTNSEHTKTTIRGRRIERTYLDTHCYVRHCKICIAKKVWTRRIINLLILGGVGYRIFDPSHIIQSIFGDAISLFLVWLIFCNFINWVIYNIFFKPDIDYAYKHNAITNSPEG